MESNLYDRIGSHNAKKLKNFFSNGGYFSLYQKGDDLYERILPNEEMTECIEYCLSSKDFVEKEVVLAKYLQNLLAEQKVSTRSYSVCPTIINVPHSTEIPFFPRPEKREVVESITTANIDDRPNASKLAKQFLSAYNVRIYQETIYVLVGSSYHPFTEAEFFRQLNDQFRLAAEHVGTTHLYREIANFIKCENAYVISDNQYLSQAHLICFTDGYLNTDNMLFYSPDPHIFFRTYVNLKYHDILNSGPTPVFDQYLRTVAGSDLLLQNRIMEMIGLCISNDMAAKAIFILQGVGNSGKSTLISLISSFFPDDLVSAISLEDFVQQFAIGEIFGKALNVNAEMGNSLLSPIVVRRLKELTGGDLLCADVKFKPRIKFRNTAKIIAATNNVVLTETPDPAFFNRLVPIVFKHTIPSGDINYNLLQSLKKEAPGILKKAITAYIKLRANNYRFSGSYGLNSLYQDQKNNLLPPPDYLPIFLEEALTPGDNNDYVSITQLLKNFRTWLAEHSYPMPPSAKTDMSFGKALRALLPSDAFHKQRIPNVQSPVSCIICYKLVEKQ